MNLPITIDGLGIKWLCYKHKVLKNGTSPIILQLIHHGKIKRYSTGQACPVEKWDFDTEGMKSWGKFSQEVDAKLITLKSKVLDIVVKLYAQGSFSLEAFDRKYTTTVEAEDVLAYLVQLADEYQTEGRAGNAAVYKSVWRVLRRFTNGKPLRFADLTPRKLEAFEKNLREHGCKDASISVYMRTLRAAVNRACGMDGLMDPANYPFQRVKSDGRYALNMKGNSTPRSLSEADMAKIKDFDFREHPHLATAVRFFLFSFYARGMNFIDMAYLERKAIKEGRFEYTRRKTMRKDGGVSFSIPVTQQLASLIDAFEKMSDRFVFPILNSEHRTEKQQWDRTRKCLKALNKQLKEVGEVLGIQVALTSYVARHTYATTLKRKGVDPSLIGDSMGHKNTSTTAVYLKRFADDVLDKANAGL